MSLRKRTRRHIFLAVAAGLTGTMLWLNWPGRAPTSTIAASAVSPDQPPRVSDAPPVGPTPDAQRDLAAPKEAVDNQQEPPPKVRPYEVVSGDTVDAIATRFGLLPATILSSNQIAEEGLLQVGQQLLIPATDGLLYIVQDGDTFWDIASAYQVEVDQIIRSNPDISPDSLQPGQRLLVPGAVRRPRSNMVVSRGDASPRPATPAPVPASDLQWPLRGEITEYFGWRTHPVYGTRNYHEGIDIAVPEGTAVTAIAPGTVELSEWYGGYGLTVKIDHGNGVVTRYSHNGVLLVQPGETVSAGQVIARSGNTGVSTGPHLDFGIYRQGQPVDPLGLLPR
jgi:murein DD-endopeptidase MepM/ murein hydrolase activator NlpD